MFVCKLSQEFVFLKCIHGLYANVNNLAVGGDLDYCVPFKLIRKVLKGGGINGLRFAFTKHAKSVLKFVSG